MKFLTIFLALFAFDTAEAWYMPREVNTIYRYQCEYTFLEGEGVSENSVSCPANQQLGFVRANYTFYLYNSNWDSNFAQKMPNVPYTNLICERQVAKTTCDGFPEPKFRLSRWPEGIFQIRIVLAPNPNIGLQQYGFAAAPDRNGFCPYGLEKVWAYVARPETQDYPLPSSFINRNGRLNNLEVLTEEEADFASFSVYRNPNATPCSNNGSCSDATFGEKVLANTYLYEKTQAPVCVIPRN
jgi:hypothetical protein